MSVTNERGLVGGSTLMAGQDGATNCLDDEKYGLAQISDLWPGKGVSSQSRKRYALPGIRSKFSLKKVEAKAL